MVKSKLIEETLILAQKYNDLIRAKNLRFTLFNINLLEIELKQKTKSQVEGENQKISEMWIYLKTLTF